MKRLLAAFPLLLALLAWEPALASGQVGTMISTPTPITLTVSTSAYVSGYAMGGVIPVIFPSVTGIVQNAVLNFNTGAFTGQTDLLVFNANPTGSTTTDHGAAVIVSADMPKLIGVIHVADCTATSTVATSCQALNQALTATAPGGWLYIVPIVRGTPTLTGASDVSLSLNVIQ